jgi:hypothetical protein
MTTDSPVTERAMFALKAFALVCLCIGVAGCATDGVSLPSFGCQAFHPITYSRSKDTRETVRQIVAHNAVGVKSCGWMP